MATNVEEMERELEDYKLSLADCCGTCEHATVVNGKHLCHYYNRGRIPLIFNPWVVCPRYNRSMRFNYAGSEPPLDIPAMYIAPEEI